MTETLVPGSVLEIEAPGKTGITKRLGQIEQDSRPDEGQNAPTIMGRVQK
jgi:hypothetical protein